MCYCKAVHSGTPFTIKGLPPLTGIQNATAGPVGELSYRGSASLPKDIVTIYGSVGGLF